MQVSSRQGYRYSVEQIGAIPAKILRHESIEREDSKARHAFLFKLKFSGNSNNTVVTYVFEMRTTGNFQWPVLLLHMDELFNSLDEVATGYPVGNI